MFLVLLHFIGGDIMKEKTHRESVLADDAIDQNHSDAELDGSIDVSTASSATEQALVMESMIVFDKVALLAEPARSNCYEKIRVKLHEYRTKDDKKNKKKHSESKKQKRAKKKRTREEYDDDNYDELQRYKLQLTTPEWWF